MLIVNIQKHLGRPLGRKIWARLGKSIDQRVFEDCHKIIMDYCLEKILTENFLHIEGFGTFTMVKNPIITYPITDANFFQYLKVKFVADTKLTKFLQLFHKKVKHETI